MTNIGSAFNPFLREWTPTVIANPPNFSGRCLLFIAFSWFPPRITIQRHFTWYMAHFYTFPPFYSSHPVSGSVLHVVGFTGATSSSSVSDRHPEKWRGERMFEQISDTLERHLSLCHVGCSFNPSGHTVSNLHREGDKHRRVAWLFKGRVQLMLFDIKKLLHFTYYFVIFIL